MVAGRTSKAESDTMSSALEATLKALGKDRLTESDKAVIALAKRYAAAIDSADSSASAMERLGPKMLGVLTALSATPASRNRSGVGTDTPDLDAELAALRESSDQR